MDHQLGEPEMTVSRDRAAAFPCSMKVLAALMTGKGKRFLRPLTLVFAILLCSTMVWAQAWASQPQQPAEPPPATAQQSPHSSQVAPPKQASGESEEHSSRETKISPQEARELFRSVDEIMKFASQDTGLPIHKKVNRRLTSRDEVTDYLGKHMADSQDTRRLKRSELVLKKFGLLPQNFDLEKFLVALLREQVAGYYDPKTKTVNLLDWVGLDQQRPVLAHELTHALQDQSFDLTKWMKAGVSDLTEKKTDPSPEDIEKDEAPAVRQAIVEGQAMAVLIDYMLAPTGQSVTTSPQLVEALKAGMLVGTADSVQFQSAPIFLKEMLTFPYRYGLDFVEQVLLKDGKQRAFAGVFRNPPTTTRQIMEPESYLSGEHIDPMRVPEFGHLTTNYDRFDVGSMGEFDVAMLVDQYEGVDASKQVYPHWRGGYYYAARPKRDPAAPLAVLYVSRWSSPETAAQFAALYAKSLKQRYHSAHVVGQQGHTPEDITDKTQELAGNHKWLTEDGDVIIDPEGDIVFITESFDEETVRKLSDAIIMQDKVERRRENRVD